MSIEWFVKTIGPYFLTGIGIATVGMGVLDFDISEMGVGCACLATGKYLTT